MNPQQPSNVTAEDEAKFAECRILIVDDNPQNVELLEAYLEGLGCETRAAADGTAALEQVERDPPDLILLDIMMPRMSGFEVCQRLKSDPATRDIPILMVTALNEVGDVERGAEAGTDDFLSKPFNKVELLTRVKSLLRLRLLKKELDRTTGRADPSRQSDLDEQTSPG
jgi:two-component system, OmpR family, alkaline phosphatase synthesis response regulator PhoP